jgi:hypothetical protein
MRSISSWKKLASEVGATFRNAIMGEKSWTRNENVICQLGTLWKNITYYLVIRGEVDNIFHSSITHQKSDACDLLKELTK